MKTLKALNLGLAFLLELALLGALGIWALSALPDSPWRFALAIGSIAVAVVLWAIWAAPRSARRLGMPWIYVFKIAMFAVGVAALVLARQPVWGGVFALLALVNLGLGLVWGQEQLSRRP